MARRSLVRMASAVLVPDERFGIGVVAVEVVVDRVLQLGHAGEGAAPYPLPRDFRKEALDEVHPRGAGWREVQLEAGMLGEPGPHLVRLVRRGVVEHDVHVELLAHGSIDPPQERDAFLREMGYGDS